jgi:hypothetical protein
VQQLEITADGTYRSAINIFDKCLLQRREKCSLVCCLTTIVAQLSRSNSGFTRPHQQFHCLATSAQARIQLPEQGGFCDQIIGAGTEPACSISRIPVFQNVYSRYVLLLPLSPLIQVLISRSPRHVQCFQHYVLKHGGWGHLNCLNARSRGFQQF